MNPPYVNGVMFLAMSCTQVWKDWHLAAITLTITGISLILLILEASIPLLRGLVTLEKDGELSNRRTVSD